MADSSRTGSATENRSLARGLNVLLALNEFNPATVTQVVGATGLAKATVIRLLQTLRSQGYIDQDKNSGGYKLLPKVRLLASSMLMSNTFSLAIKRYLSEFAQQVKWPSDFLMPEGSAMTLQVTSRNVAPITLKRFDQTRFPLLRSASGQAYLSVLPGAERQRTIATLSAAEGEGQPENLARHTEQQALVARQQGYATAYYNTPLDGICVFAMPVVVNDRPIGALAILLLHEAVTEHQLEDSLLPRLREAATEVGKLYMLHGGPAVGAETDPLLD